ncbi:MAG TPA: alcohol dehydrogenase [Polyangiaceae bacterium]|nr:alcohol dehydrogenase [Polyangiaceae bacterium]
MSTYRVMQVTERGKLELSERPLLAPGPGKVRIRVEACGICHTDVVTVEGLLPNLTFPRVPGHEVVGRIDAVGEGVSRWSVGQRVGVGYLGGHCGQCAQCRRGVFVHCLEQPISGATTDGGYADVMVAEASGLASVPDGLTAIDAAPLLCAGLTTFNALRNSPARPGDLVAVQGIGGLGHLGVQYARHMGFRVVAIARGGEKQALAERLGAHHYIDSGATDPAKALLALGGARLILTTASNSPSMSALFAGLAPGGKMLAVGVDGGPIEIGSIDLVLASRSLEGALTGSAADGEDTLAFSVLQGIRPMTETMPLTAASEAYAKMVRNEARFRVVLVTGQA